jgi:hypothetical protein
MAAMSALLVADLPHQEPCAVETVAAPATQPPKPPPGAPPAEAVEPSVARRATSLEVLRPHIPVSIQNRIAQPLQVTLRIRVDENGRVLSAQPDDYHDGLQRYLATRAAESARSIRFRPAEDNFGRPIPSIERIVVPFYPR